MSSDTTAASKQTSGESTVGSGVGHGAGDGADTKGKDLSGHPGESGTSSSKEGDHDHDSATSEHGTLYHPRGPPSKPAHGGPKR